MSRYPGDLPPFDRLRAVARFPEGLNAIRVSQLRGLVIIGAGLFCYTAAARADVTISADATSNMSCSAGVCSPTAVDAVLNVSDLENLLASGNVEVTTTGSGVQAGSIDVDAALSWPDANTLALDAYQSVTVEQPVSASGPGGLSLTTNDGGSDGLLLFLQKGNVTFSSLSSTLAIDGTDYALVNTLPLLATAIAANPSGAYALAAGYNASKDGVYATSPIPTTFTGSFNGLGNEISNLTINDTAQQYSGVNDALFSEVGTGGAVASIRIRGANVSAVESYVAGVVGINQGMVLNTFAAGSFSLNANNSNAPAAGLVGWNFGGTIMYSHANAQVTVSSPENGAAGLVGTSTGLILGCYATGTASMGDEGFAGGLVIGNSGTIEQSYSRVKVSGQYDATLGGLVGGNVTAIVQSYSTGSVKDNRDGHGEGYKGGFVGEDESNGGISLSYWDTSTSHIRRGGEGAGTPRRDPGITGLTTEQLQSGLPKGFDPNVWAEDPKINNGLPYLIDNPPED